MAVDIRPGFAFVLPWSFDSEGGGVVHAVVGLADQCIAESLYRPVALELSWNTDLPRQDAWRGLARIRLGLRAPWSEKRPFRAAISYVLHLPLDIYSLRRVMSNYNLRVINRQFPGLESFSFVLMRHLRLFRGRNVFTFQGSDVRLVLGTRGLLRRIWKWTLRRVDVLVFVSDGLKEEFLAFDPKLRNRCVVVHNGVDVEAFIRRSEETAASNQLFQGTHDLVLSVGRFEHRKGHDLLVRAFELVLRQHSNARLAIVGRSGPTFEATRTLIADRGLANHVALLTDIPYREMPAVIRRADVFVLCSRWEKGKFGEGFPLALAEAGALTRPVVSTRSTGCDEIIEDGETGRLVPVDDPAALARAIGDVLSNPADAERMAVNLHNLVCSQFTWRHIWNRYRIFLEA